MIFLSGIHGVGKSYFCHMVEEKLGIKSYSASALITARRSKGFSADKLVSDIDDNQPLLLKALDELRSREDQFVLDGHFCLLNASGEITRIPKDIYISLKPGAIILLTEKPEVIAERRFQRDGIHQSVAEITTFQNAKCEYANEISGVLCIPLIVTKGAEYLEYAIDFIRSGGK